MTRPRGLGACVILALVAPGCHAVVPSAESDSMNGLAERYVKLVLALGQHDADYVDAYYGPPEWRKDAEARRRSLPDIDREAVALLAALGAATPDALAGE